MMFDRHRIIISFSVWVCFLITDVLLPGQDISLNPSEPSMQQPRQEKDDKPLFECLPFNRLTLTSNHNGAVYDVQPINFFEGGRPDPLPRSGELTIRFVNNPLKEYHVKWNSIEKIELFSELVLQEFNDLLQNLSEEVQNLSPDDTHWQKLSGRFDVMFDYLRFLQKYREELPGYSITYQKFLYEEAVYRTKSKDYVTGLARFERLYQENKSYPNLETVWGETLQTVMENETKNSNEAKCRRYLIGFKEFYPENRVVKIWEERLLSATKKRCEQSKQAFAKRDYLIAHIFCEEAAKITPESPELIEWRRKLLAEIPRIDIAVNDPLPADRSRMTAGLPDRASERCRRILCRMLCEYVRPSLEGGVYTSPFGEMDKPEKRLIRWKIPSEPNSAFCFDAYDVAETILTLAAASTQSTLSTSSIFPRHVISNLDVVSPNQLDVRLRRSFLIPESLFVFPVLPSPDVMVAGTKGLNEKLDLTVNDSEDKSETLIDPLFQTGLFSWELRKDRRDGLQINAHSEAGHGPKVVFEHAVFRGEEAVEMLRAGKIDMIDRIPPWELENLKQDRNFVTGKYSIPTMHFLVPNLKKPLTSSRTFRRALLYGLNRTGMLGKLLGKSGEGNVVSVPFIRGNSLGDPLGYAYDSSIEPRPYEPKLAMALSQLAFDQVRKREDGWEELLTMPAMILARPKHETAEFIAMMIRRQWEAIGVSVKIVEYRDNEPIGRNPEIDFWLVERSVKEPLIDAERIFGGGLMGVVSPYMELALEKLSAAEDWPTAGKRLQELHRLCFEETTVLPLWQITEYYVHRIGLGGISDANGLPDLYKNILRWTVLPATP